MHFVMSRVTEEDLDEMLEIQFRAFAHVDVHTALFGPNTQHHRDLTKARFLKDMKEDVADCWMKLVDKSTGKIVSCAQWKIYPTWAPMPEHPPFKADYFDDADERKWAEEMCADFMEKRAARMYNHAHVCTSSSYLFSTFTSTDNIISLCLQYFTFSSQTHRTRNAALAQST
jgi:hypothetical protein